MPVRWNSTHKMADTFIKLKVPIMALCASQNLDPSMRDILLTNADWAILEKLRQLFEIFVKPSTVLQGDVYPTMSITIPHYLRMIQKLTTFKEEVGETTLIGKAADAAISKLNKYFTANSSAGPSYAVVATALDPRLTLRVFDKLLSGSEQQNQKRRAKAFFSHIYSQYSTRQRLREFSEMTNADHRPSLVDDYDSDDDIFVSAANSARESEANRWQKEPSVGKNTDILRFWKSREVDYPILAQMARDYLAIPATSAASERVFSQGGDIVTKKRNRLHPDSVRYLLCLRSWGIFPDEEDLVEEEEED